MYVFAQLILYGWILVWLSSSWFIFGFSDFRDYLTGFQTEQHIAYTFSQSGFHLVRLCTFVALLYFRGIPASLSNHFREPSHVFSMVTLDLAQTVGEEKKKNAWIVSMYFACSCFPQHPFRMKWCILKKRWNGIPGCGLRGNIAWRKRVWCSESFDIAVTLSENLG